MEALKIGKRGTLVVPAKLRKQYGLSEGSFVTAESRKEGILLRPAQIVTIEVYTARRKAEFLLNNAVNKADYERARRAVVKLGIDPDSVPHDRP